jgi:hypothetical protein
MLDSEVTNIAALESCIGKTPGRCIFRIVLAQPRAAIAVLIPMPKMPVMRRARSSARELGVKCWWHFVLVTLKISVRE